MNSNRRKSLKSGDSDIMKLIAENSQMERTLTYAQGGRRFGRLTSRNALAAWKRAILELSKAPENRSANRKFSDIDAELSLRGLSPSYDEVSAAWISLSRAAKTRFIAMLSDTNQRESLLSSIAGDILRYLIMASQPQN